VPSLIEEYALLGNCRGSALVSKDGSLDWLCLPRFDSAACCAALLGTDEHGCWKLAPLEPVRSVQRRYRQGTLILESEVRTDSGMVRIIEFMAPQTDTAEIFRIVQGVEGQVQMRSHLAPRFDYGSIVPWALAIERGVRLTAGPDSLFCRSDPLWKIEKGSATTEFIIAAGEQVSFELTWGATHEPEPTAKNAQQTLADAGRWWLEWSNQCQYHGPWSEVVRASLIVL
jgi:GH15 family glucan-1,4-alpha-glucosidase